MGSEGMSRSRVRESLTDAVWHTISLSPQQMISAHQGRLTFMRTVVSDQLAHMDSLDMIE